MGQNAKLVLDEKIAEEFQKQAEQTMEYPLDYGRMSSLKRELMELCDVTELESLNILCGRNVKDYIHKYERLSKGIVVVPKEYRGVEQVVYKIMEEETVVYDMDRSVDISTWSNGKKKSDEVG